MPPFTFKGFGLENILCGYHSLGEGRYTIRLVAPLWLQVISKFPYDQVGLRCNRKKEPVSLPKDCCDMEGRDPTRETLHYVEEWQHLLPVLFPSPWMDYIQISKFLVLFLKFSFYPKRALLATKRRGKGRKRNDQQF